MAATNPSASSRASAGQVPTWRGPGPGRPDLPVPPARQRLIHRGQLRKRWRYVGFYGEELMLCAAVAQIGPFSHTFWSVWDRAADDREGLVLEHTRMRPGNPEVILDGPEVSIRTKELRADLRFGESEPIEVVGPSGRGWGWTRKRAGVPVEGEVEISGRRLKVEGFGVDDESAGYHARHTAWYWSAGVGVDRDGRAVGWNLVEGINDPVRSSERAIWVEGVPYEPEPVEFDHLSGVRFAGETEAGLRFDFGGAERSRKDNFGLIRSEYTHRFGTFEGGLDGIELANGAGVMEQHKVAW